MQFCVIEHWKIGCFTFSLQCIVLHSLIDLLLGIVLRPHLLLPPSLDVDDVLHLPNFVLDDDVDLTVLHIVGLVVEVQLRSDGVELDAVELGAVELGAVEPAAVELGAVEPAAVELGVEERSSDVDESNIVHAVVRAAVARAKNGNH